MIRAYRTLTVPVPGTPIRVTSLEPDPSASQGCHAVLMEALPTNAGRVWIGTSQLNVVARIGVFSYLAVPTLNFAPSFSAALTLSPGGIQLRDLYVDAEQANDGVIITILVT